MERLPRALPLPKGPGLVRPLACLRLLAPPLPLRHTMRIGEAVALPYYLLLSRSITHAQRMSGVLEAAGITARFFRPPIGLTDRSCGYAVRVNAPYLPAALERLRAAGMWPSKVFYQDGTGAFSEVSI